jgi:hypothetical protein
MNVADLDELAGHDFAHLSPHFSVRVPLERAPVDILWINWSWFQSRGLPTNTSKCRRLIECWMRDRFGLHVARIAQDSVKSGQADRYGAPNGTLHGGSGRCVFIGRYNLKGVGATPLVPPNLGNHADGLLRLEDGLWEVIASEACRFVLPDRAEPILGLLRYRNRHSQAATKTVLIVRPNVFRPAHMERSLLFGTAGTETSDQYVDHLRSLAVRRHFQANGVSAADIASKVASTVGILDVFRLSQGRYTSSNVSIEGAVIDFGSFRFMSDWRYARLERSATSVFGKDLQFLVRDGQSWERLISVNRNTNVKAIVNEAYRSSFTKALARALALPSCAPNPLNSIEFLLAHFLAQRSGRETSKWPFVARHTLDAFSETAAFCDALAKDADAHHNVNFIDAWQRFQDWSKPRNHSLYSEFIETASALPASSTEAVRISINGLLQKYAGLL